MSWFSKFNFKARWDAQDDVKAFNFLTDVICISCSASSSRRSLVSVTGIMQRVAEGQAESLAQITGGQGLEYQAAMKHLSALSTAFTTLAVNQLGETCELEGLISCCQNWMQNIYYKMLHSASKGYLHMTASNALILFQNSEHPVLNSVRNGYLNMTASDAQMLLETSEHRINAAFKLLAK